MKKIMTLLAIVLLVVSCKECPNELSIKTEKAAIEDLLEQYVIAIENEDLLKVENSWSASDSILMFGTDSDEKLLGWEKIRKAYLNQFNLISDTYISVNDQFIRINCTGNTAWFSQSMNYNFMYDSIAHSFDGIRFSGVCDKDEDGNWRLVQGHLSVPAQVNIGKR